VRCTPYEEQSSWPAHLQGLVPCHPERSALPLLVIPSEAQACRVGTAHRLPGMVCGAHPTRSNRHGQLTSRASFLIIPSEALCPLLVIPSEAQRSGMVCGAHPTRSNRHGQLTSRVSFLVIPSGAQRSRGIWPPAWSAPGSQPDPSTALGMTKSCGSVLRRRVGWAPPTVCLEWCAVHTLRGSSVMASPPPGPRSLSSRAERSALFLSSRAKRSGPFLSSRAERSAVEGSGHRRGVLLVRSQIPRLRSG